MAAPQTSKRSRSEQADARPGMADEAQPAVDPYVSASDTSMREFTPQAVITGAVLGIVFAASSLYLVLKVGMTVSASITKYVPASGAKSQAGPP